MKKMITLAILTMIMAGQVHAAPGGSTSSAVDSNAATTSATDAKKSADRLALANQIKDLRGQINSSAATKGLSPSEKVKLVKVMMQDTEMKAAALEALSDKEATREEVNGLILTGIANVSIESNGTENALNAMGVSADVTVAKNAYRTMLTSAAKQAKTWKGAEAANFKIFMKEAVRLKAEGKSELEAMNGGKTKLKADAGIDIDLRKLEELCKKLA